MLLNYESREETISSLKESLSTADRKLNIRPKTHRVSNEIAEIYFQWQDQLIKDIITINENLASLGLADKAIFSGYRGILVAGLLGLARIYHTSLNDRIQLTRNKKHKAELFQKVKTLRNTIITPYINSGLAPTHTIDGNAIDWIGETDQDFLNTLTQPGISSRHSLETEIFGLDAIDNAIERYHRTPLTEVRHRASIQSALGVIRVRLGRFQRSQETVHQGLIDVVSAHQDLPNLGRLAHIGQKALASSILDWGSLEINHRFSNFYNGMHYSRANS